MGIERGGKCAGIGRALASALAAAAFALFGAASAGAETLKIATLSPDGSLWMKLLREGAEQAAAQTAGRVAFKFYPGGVMGDDKAVLRKIRVGQLHGAVVTSSALVQTYADIALYSMPMAFRSAEEVDHVRQRMDGQLLAGLEGEGFQPLKPEYRRNGKPSKRFSWPTYGCGIGSVRRSRGGLALRLGLG